MPQCAVATCRNSHRRTRGRRIRYHRFPQIPEVRSRWVCACGRLPLPNGEIPFNIQTARICSLHFTNESYEKDMEHLVLGLPARSRLRRGAVPTVGVPVSVEPVTRMLVEDARRSLLKVAHAKILNGQKAVTTSNGGAADRDTKTPKVRLKQPRTNQQQSRASGSQQSRASSSQQSRATNHNRQLQQQQQKRIQTQRQIQIQQRIQQQANNNLKEQQQRSLILEEENNLNNEVNILLALGLQPRLNKMHAMDENSSVASANSKNMKATEKKEDDDFSRQSPQVPQSQQNGAALPEEAVITAAERLHSSGVKEEPHQDGVTDLSKKLTTDSPLTKQAEDTKSIRDDRVNRKRRSTTDEMPSTNGNTNTKKICLEQREQLVSSLITGYENASSDELASRADVLRVELQALDELARAAEMEWNRVLTMRKLKEEAYLRIERRRQVVNFMESHDRLNDLLSSAGNVMKDKSAFSSQEEQMVQSLGLFKNSDKISKSLQQTAQNLSNRLAADSRRQELLGDNRQVGEGRQGPTVDVRSIIADYRLRHPESVPRRGRRLRNSVNVNLGAGGAVMENNQNADSRPSSTDSCKSNPNMGGSNSLNFKDVLVHFAKLSQQQGEPVKTPQNYPDVTLHPVAPSPTPTPTLNSAPQPSGSLLHGILTKSQSPRPTTFSPTLARLLTAPERERSAPVTTVTPHQNSASQRMMQAYQETNPVSISELLSSSKGRTEITITPVVNAPLPSHGNNMMQVDDEEEASIMEERESRISGGSRDDRDISPRCQGCHERAAQYVCAGCGNQWYCSPECQAAAWDEHSEVCSG